MRHSAVSIVIVSTSTKEEAKVLARGLLDSSLTACAHIHGPVLSLFRWNSKIRRAKEFVLVLKTLTSVAGKVVSYIEENHSYDCPVIEVIPCSQTNIKALQWLTKTIH